MATDKLQRAIACVRLCFEPPTQFVSGIRIHEPEQDDPLASKKRAIISFALNTADAFESGKLYDSAELADLEKKVNEYSDSINDAEMHDYRELLRAMREMIAIGAKASACW